MFAPGALQFALAVLAAPCIAVAAPVSRLEASSFTAVPAAVRSGLAKQGCTVPQTDLARRPHNVVRGSFTKARTSEWAALCSVGGTSEILVFGAASSQPIARLAKAPDENFIQAVALGSSGFSRRLRAVRSSVQGLNGVEDAYLGKASTVWVYERGHWQEKPGAD